MLEKYEMSHAQKRIYTIEMLMDERSTVYNVPTFFKLTGSLNLNKLKNSFIELVKRHEIFRTQFDEMGEKFLQIICDDISFDFVIENADKSELYDKCKEFIRPFDIKKAPLFRIKVLNFGNNEYLFMFDIHHIIFDGASESLIIKEIIDLYQGIELPAVKYHYKTFSAWQRRLDLSKQKEYWLNEFQGNSPVLNLKTDYLRMKKPSYKGSNVTILIEKETKTKIKKLIKKQRVTDFMLMITVFMLMLYKYTRQDEIVIGVPSSGRTHNNMQNMIGMFVNSLAIKGIINSEMSFDKLLSHVKEKCLRAYENQDYPFDELVQSLNLHRELSRNPIFDVLFVYSNLTKGTDLRFGNLEVGSVFIEQKVSKFDITLSVTETEKGYVVDFEYCTDLFKPETIALMGRHYAVLLDQVTDHPDYMLDQISMLDEDEINKISLEFNNTAIEYPHDKSVIELF
uniref:condensation domain-containing protein n=1 Tax=Lacrimispora sp. TaxID=2719234 RepID=UPI0028AFB3B6